MSNAVLPPNLIGRSWSTSHGSFDSYDLARVLDAIERGRSITDALGVTSLTDRRADRALQLLRKHGLIRFDAHARAWVLA